MRRLILSLFLGLAGFGFAPPGMAATPSPKGAVVINEIMYHPRTAGNEYIELYNNSVNSAFDLGGFRLDGIGFVFAPGTAIPPRGYLVLANNRSAFATAYGAAIPVAGEFGGTLDPGGGTLRLVQPGVPPATDEVICEVTYGSSPPWPADANGGGASLQLIDPAQDTRRVANWGVSTNNAPATPKWQFVALTGIATKSILLIGMTDAGSVYLDDIKLVKGSVPESGVNCLTNGDFESVLAGPWTVSDNMTGSAISTAFSHSGKASLHVVASSGGPTIAQAIWQNTTTLETNATYTLSYWYLPSMDGTSTLIRLSGSSPNSGHVYCLQNFQPPAVTTSLITPGAENSVHATLATIPTVWLNEIVPNNTNGARDHLGHSAPWVELYNAGGASVNLGGLFLSDGYTNLTRWAFPANATLGAGQYQVIWLDGHPEETTTTEWHASFTARPTSGSLALAQKTGTQTAVIDYLDYAVPTPDQSYGVYPDGASNHRIFPTPTPGLPNPDEPATVRVWINEWMAQNTGTLVDPFNGKYEDWFELYNPGALAVDLSGYFLTDSPVDRTKSAIPAGTVLGPNSYWLVWADGSSQAGGSPGPVLHANFKLSKASGYIGLYTPGGLRVDGITYGSQTSDVTEGRWPDGGTNIVTQSKPTPSAANSGQATGGGIRITDIRLAGGQVTLTWASQAGTHYRAEYKNDLSAEVWSNLGVDVLATETATSTTDTLPAGAPARFYRIVVMP